MKINPEPDVAWLEGYELPDDPCAAKCIGDFKLLVDDFDRTQEYARGINADCNRRVAAAMPDLIIRRLDQWPTRGMPPQRWFDEQAMIAAGLTAKDLK